MGLGGGSCWSQRGSGGVVWGGEVPLWETRTIIKDSTAASAWFACLIICHMLHTSAISHIRALPLQQTSLRLDEAVGEQTPCRKSEQCEGFTHSSVTYPTILSYHNGAVLHDIPLSGTTHIQSPQVFEYPLLKSLVSQIWSNQIIVNNLRVVT